MPHSTRLSMAFQVNLVHFLRLVRTATKGFRAQIFSDLWPSPMETTLWRNMQRALCAPVHGHIQSLDKATRHPFPAIPPA
jgi:hypothetical protein